VCPWQQGFVFLLIGQQLAPVTRGLSDYATSTIVTAAGITLAVVLLLRPLWLLLTESLPGALRARRGAIGPVTRGLSVGGVLILSWAGTRGVITLAAIFSLPLVTDSGALFPGRDLLLFCAYLVVLVTLVGGGFTFAPLVRVIGLRADAAEDASLRNEARAASIRAALHRVDQLADDDEATNDAMISLRASLDQRLTRYRGRPDLLEGAEDGRIPVSPRYEAALHARRAVIDAQRDELLRWRDAGHLPDSSLRILERELDHEERTLPAGSR
jgi:CPA1 family monovalent cation:H+ antiporter